VADHTTNPDPVLLIPEAAAYIGRDERFVRQLVERRTVPYLKLGRRVAFRRSTLDAWLDSTVVPARPTSGRRASA
jgi:excisionase family DNA binding protein